MPNDKRYEETAALHGQQAAQYERERDAARAALAGKHYDADVLHKALDALILSAEVVQLRYGLKSPKYKQVNDAIVRIRQVLATG